MAREVGPETDRSKSLGATHLAGRVALQYVVFEALPYPVVAVDAHGAIGYVNPAFAATFGYKRDDVLGEPVELLLPERVSARHVAHREAFLAEPVARPMGTGLDLVGRRKDGTEFPVEISLSPVETGAGLQVFATVVDITERKHAEEAVREASRYARTLLEASLDPLVAISPEGKITDVNSATETATGVPRSELVGTDFGDYFTEPERARAGYRRVLAEGLVRDYPLTIRHISGRTMDVLYNATVYRGQQGEAVGVFAAARDITERKHAEEAVRELNVELEQRVRERTAELEASNRDLESFTYSVSHDLRAPLRAIEGFTQILRDDHADRLDAEGQRVLGVIVHNTQRMGRLIDDLLLFSRASRYEFALAPVDISAVARVVVDEVRGLEPGREVAVAVGDLGTAWADPGLLRQVLTNLVANAFKFTRPRPDARVEIGREDLSDEIAVFVRDNGVGFDPRYAGKLFQVFQRLHASDQFEGTGIGLALVARIVARHGGRVWAEGEPEAGATFWFSLPKREEGRE